MTVVYLARHGESAWNADRRITGQLDPELSPRGRRQAHTLATVLAMVPLRSVHSSTLRRTRDTAAPTAAAHHLAPQPHPALVEQHLGALQGRWRDSRDPEAQRLWAERKHVGREFTAPGGESFAELRDRVVACLERIVGGADGGAILIVGHRNVNRVILEHLLGRHGAATGGLTPRSRWVHEITLGAAAAVATIDLDGGRIGSRREVAAP